MFVANLTHWQFQLTAARRRLALPLPPVRVTNQFQLTAARRRLVKKRPIEQMLMMFQLTAARRRLAQFYSSSNPYQRVSTHSRPKAAGWIAFL